MRKTIIKLSGFLLLFAFVATSIVVLLKIYDSNSQEEDIKDVTGKDNIMKAFWNSNKIEDESVMLVSGNGEAPCGNLMFLPVKVNKVVTYSQDGEKIWQEDVDYIIEGKSIIALNKDMPYMTDKEVTGEEKIEGLNYTDIPSVTQGLSLPFTEGTELLYRQVYVSYEYEEQWDYNVPTYAGDKLKNTLEKLENNENLNVFVYGDSISTGANSTGYLGVYPKKPSWPEEVTENLREFYGGTINLLNMLVGGWTSENAIMSTESIGWVQGKQITQAGIKKTLAQMPDYYPDLVILGFGMNDATNGIDKDTYKLYMKKIISNIRERNSQCEFILIGTMLANPMAKNQSKEQISYYNILKEIAENEEGIISVNIGQMNQDMLDCGKHYIDLTANNVNHPNDFMASIYTMNILSLLIDEEK